MRPLWTHDFTIITLGSIISMLGNSVAGFAISLLVLDYTGSTFLYVLFLVCNQLPRLVAPMLAGPLLDRVSRKKVIYSLDFLSVGIYLMLTLVIAKGWFNYPFLLAMNMVIGGVDSVHAVAYDSFYPNLISAGNFTRAYSISSLIQPMAQVMMPVAAVLYRAMGTVAPLFAFNSFSFLLAACLERSIRYEETHMAAELKFGSKLRTHFWGDFREGFAYIRGEPGLMVITAYFFVTNLTGSATTLHLPFFRNHAALFSAVPVSAVTLYAIISNFNTGGRFLGGLAHYRFRYPTEKKFAIALTVYITLSFLDMTVLFLPVPLMALAMLVMGMLAVTSYNIRISATQDYVPDCKRARFNSTFLVVTTAGSVIGQLAAGALAEWFPERGIIIGFMVINLLGAALLMGRGAEQVKPIYNRQV